MTPDEAIKSGFKKYFSFRGRASETEFWWFISLVWICLISAEIADILIFASNVREELAAIEMQLEPLDALEEFVGLLDQYSSTILKYPLIFLTIPAFSLGARRMHDIGQSGWRQIPLLLPLFFGLTFTSVGYLMQKFGIFEGGAVLLPAFLALIGGGALAFASFDRIGDAGRNEYGPAPDR